MRTQKVIVVPYDENWPEDFEKIRKEIAAACRELLLCVEHVGSTSVCGMSAKPCIDLDAVIEGMQVFPEVCRCLEKIGYMHEGNLGIEGREAFCYENKDHLKKHHLYVCPKDSPELLRHTAFRDYLKSCPEAVEEYSRIKEEAAALFPDDIDGYIRHKSPCIEKIYRRLGI